MTGLARGALRGLTKREEDKLAKEERDRRLIESLADKEGFSVEDADTADAPLELPKVKAGSGGKIGGSGVLKDLPMPDLPDPAEAPKRRPIEVARATIRGRKVVVGVDPAKTKAGKKAAHDTENKSAHGRLSKIRPGETGAFDPDVDYIDAERSELSNQHTIDALVKSGAATKDEAELLVRKKIDLPERNRKAAADQRAEEREDRADRREDRADRTETERERRDRERLELERRRTTATEKRAAGAGRAAAREDLHSVERQVDDTRSDLAREERDTPKPVLPGMETPEYNAAVGASKSKIGGLRARADSLGQVRDSIAGEVQGRKPAPKPAPTTASSSGVDQKAITAEFKQAAALYQKLLAKPGVDKAKAKEAYDQTVTAIAKRHGAIK
jgi:hypothetical protein